MIHFPSRAQQALLAGLVLLAVPAAQAAPLPTVPTPLPGAPGPTVPPPAAPNAIAPPPAAPDVVAPAPSASPPTVLVDPQVTALFNQTIAAHQALSALSATITMSSAGLGPASSQTIMLEYRKPSDAKVAVSDGTGSLIQFVSNGKTLVIYAAHDKKYRTDPVPAGAGANVIPTVLAQSLSILARLIGQPQALGELLTQPGVTARVGAPDSVDGVPTDTVLATLTAPGNEKIQFTFALGAADHLLRRMTQTATVPDKSGAPQTLTHTETVTALNAAPTLSASNFTFTPPPGATKMVPPVPGASAPGQPGAEPPMHDPRLVPGAKPTAFIAKDLSGRPLSLAQYKGKVVLMDFWATWCGPCVGEMPNVIAAYKKYHAQGFDIVGISLDQSRPALTAFIAQNKMPWRQVFDGKGWQSAVPRRYGVMAIPFGLLIGRDGRIAAVDVRGAALPSAIRQALAKKQTATAK